MKQFKEKLDLFLVEALKSLGFIVSFIPKMIWLFIFLQVVLYLFCTHMDIDTVQLFIIQFPFTLWVLVGKNKDGNK